MPPRFLERMQSQLAMQAKWHRDPHSGPPAYHDLDPTAETLPAYQLCSPPPVYQESDIDLDAFPEGSTILVIGAYTRQGMRVIDQLLENSYAVRGVVANRREANQTSKHFEARNVQERYQPCIIADPMVGGAFDAAARSCSGVVFVTNRSSPVAGCGVETLARVMSVLGSAMREADMNRFIYCCPAATATDGFGQRLAQENSFTARIEDASARPPSYESTRNGMEESRPETVPFSIELALHDWIGSNQPGFLLDIVSLPSGFGTGVTQFG